MSRDRRDKYTDYSTPHIEGVIDAWVRGDLNREIFRLWLIKEYSYEQIAGLLYISEKTVARCIQRYDEHVFLHL